MSDMKNIYDVLDEIGFENQCEKYALGFHRDTDTPTMTKFRQESIKEFCFSLIQQYAEKVYEDFIRTRKALEQSEICCTEWEKQALDYKAENIALSGDLERTRKALDVAVDALKIIGSGKVIEHSVMFHEDDNKIFIANKALEQITALEQKD